MKSNKDLTEKEFEISKHLKRAMMLKHDLSGMQLHIMMAIELLYSE